MYAKVVVVYLCLSCKRLRHVRCIFAVSMMHKLIFFFSFLFTDSSLLNAADSTYGPSVSDVQFLLDDLCPVCGDRVSGYHYGLQTCESCKGQRQFC